MRKLIDQTIRGVRKSMAEGYKTIKDVQTLEAARMLVGTDWTHEHRNVDGSIYIWNSNGKTKAMWSKREKELRKY